ncbi:oligopeptide transporter 4 [Artemisia annua]|uniref:Oligopeptide transporter 4 n=1 Tax=Artemisia annua TaxID=35608 RepID=A0A2U1LNZ6_ARTAN|nr:oligopeptide transporter 4 [Artemisia annua]
MFVDQVEGVPGNSNTHQSNSTVGSGNANDDGTVSNFFVYRYQKQRWRTGYNYILSAALDASVAFMAVRVALLYLSLGVEEKGVIELVGCG